MGNCIFCGKPAGFLKNEHKECREASERERQRKEALIIKGRQEMVGLVSSAINAGDGLDSLEQQLRNIAEAHSIDPSQIEIFLIRGWESALESALEDGVLSDKEEAILIAFAERFSLSQTELDTKGFYTQMIQAGHLEIF